MAASDHADGTEQTCPECGGRVESTAIETTCADCGLVLDESPIDHGPEWTYHGPEDREKVRAERMSPPEYPDRGLGSEIAFDPEDPGVADLRTTHEHTRRTRANRTRAYGCGEIQRITGQMDLPDVVGEQGKRLYQQLHNEGELVGMDMDAVAAACLYTACRVHQQGISPGEIANYARTKERWISRRHRWVCRTLDLGIEPPNYEQRLRVVAREAGIDSKAVERARERLRSFDGETLCRGSPSTLAAALLYEASNETQATLAEAAGVTTASLRNRRDRLQRAEPQGQMTLDAWGTA